MAAEETLDAAAAEEILDAAAEILWSGEMEGSLLEFRRNHAAMFATTVGGPSRWSLVDGEHRLEWTQAHQDFRELFEFQLERFLSAQSISQQQFLAACRTAHEGSRRSAAGSDSGSCYSHDGAGYAASIVDAVLMIDSYDFFLRTMIQQAADTAAEAEAAAAGQPPQPDDIDDADI